MAEQRLTEDELALVLRRAAELDDLSSVAGADADGLPVAAVEAAAAEVGLAPAAVRQAVAELRAGMLDDLDDRVGRPEELIVCARVVPGDPRDAVARFLSRQMLVKARERGGIQVWRPREDMVAHFVRRFDWFAAVRLRSVVEVTIRTVAVEGGTLTRIVARISRPVASAPGLFGIGGGVLAATAGGLAMGVADPALVVGVTASGAAGVAGGVGGVAAGRSYRRSRRDRVADAIEGLLDDLELGRMPGEDSALERLRRRARAARHGGRWA